MDSIKLINKKSDFFLILLPLLFIATISLSFKYYDFLNFKENNLLNLDVKVLNIYDKDEYKIAKLKALDFTFFTSFSKDLHFEKEDFLNLTIITNKVNFYDFLKGFYVQSFNLFKLEKSSLKKIVYENITNQHKNDTISQLFQAIFLAIPTNNNLREFFANFSISHLIAISGFHLGVLSFVIYGIFYYPYKFFQERYFPYRNRKFDLSLITLTILFLYLLFTEFVPSLFRAFIMLFLGLLFLRSNIKIFSFETLLFTLLLIVSLFPSYIFSLSLWFSICGVFYIFLYIQYFKDINKIFSIIFFNFWIFFIFNPIVHFFFEVTSYAQLYSPILTLIFTVFYPLELFLHLISYGNILDFLLEKFFSLEYSSFEILTPLWFFIIYVFCSFCSIFSKNAFFILNILMLCFNLYLFL